jgi:2-oxoisovalerate dehydrogenase E1 component
MGITASGTAPRAAAPFDRSFMKPSARGPKRRSTSIDPDASLQFYRQMFLLRRFELTVQDCYRKGEMPGFLHLYVGEEAVAVGVCAHLRPTDWITSTHRGHGHALAKGMSPRSLMAELFAKATGCCGGRGGSMHLYDASVGLFGTNGIVVGGNPSAVGAAISARARGTDGVAVAFFGDGGVNHGSFHESINFAAVQRAPVVFVCENNLYATATPLANATLNPDIASKAAAYGIPGVAVDGNDVLAVAKAAGEAVARARAGEGPTLLEARTYRFVGHHEGDPVVGVYRSQDEIDRWTKRDPLQVLRSRLLAERVSADQIEAIESKVNRDVQDALAFARSSPAPVSTDALDHAWADPINPPIPAFSPGATKTQTWLEAVRDGIAEEMRRNDHILYFGEGTGERGGSFGHTKGLWQEFGARRMVDTPICELGFTGAAIGAGATGCPTVADLMFADFIFEAAGQIVLQASKLRYISNNQMSARMVVRAGSGTVKSTGPHHSGTYHPIWAHVPGLIVAMPSNPADAKGLMKTALRAQDPVIFLEPKILFASKGAVPEGEYLVPFGQAKIAREGADLTLVACGWTVPASLDAAARLEQEGLSVEVIDLRTIVPLDLDTIVASATKTTRLLIVGPIGRLHTEPVSHPFSPKLEEGVLISVDKICAAARSVRAGYAPVPRRARGAGAIAASGAAERPIARVATPPVVNELIQTADGPAPAKPSIEGTPLIMPHGDLTVTEATVVAWLKQPGDAVKAGEIVVEVETAKAILSIESQIDGRLVEIVAPVNAVVKMGEQLGTLRAS